MKNILLYISAILLSVFFSCNHQDEESVMKMHQVPTFHTVELNSTFDVFLTEDSTFSLEIIAPESVINKIDFKVDQETLIIENNKKLKWSSPKDENIKLYIKSKPLKRINAKETCNVKTLNPITSESFGIVMESKANLADLQLNCDRFYYWNNFPCGGKLTLSGQTKELLLWNTAIMSIDAKSLLTDYALVENNSKGKCEVNVLKRIEYKISNSGDIHVYGNPEKIVNNGSSSTGKLIEF